ncbi:MAG: hypothetical protein EOO05_20815, partial [Chitinophagaceae bacterium]
MKKIFTWLLFIVTCMNQDLSAQVYQTPSCSELGSSTYGPMYSTATANSTNRTAVIYNSSLLTAVVGAPMTNVYFKRVSTT